MSNKQPCSLLSRSIGLWLILEIMFTSFTCVGGGETPGTRAMPPEEAVLLCRRIQNVSLWRHKVIIKDVYTKSYLKVYLKTENKYILKYTWILKTNIFSLFPVQKRITMRYLRRILMERNRLTDVWKTITIFTCLTLVSFSWGLDTFSIFQELRREKIGVL